MKAIETVKLLIKIFKKLSAEMAILKRGWQNDRKCVYYNFSSFIGRLRSSTIIMDF